MAKKLVVLVTRGADDERATVAWTVANGGVNSGLDVSIFLASAGVDLVRKGAADLVQVNPADPPLKELIDKFMSGGGTVWACMPCAKVRGYEQDDLLDGVIIAGSVVMHEAIKEGAATLSF